LPRRDAYGKRGFRGVIVMAENLNKLKVKSTPANTPDEIAAT